MPRIVLHVWEVSFCGIVYRFLGCPVSFCSGFNISRLIEQPSSLLYKNGNFDPGSYRGYIEKYPYGQSRSIHSVMILFWHGPRCSDLKIPLRMKGLGSLFRRSSPA